jgi:S1-C subfamily serine protease
VAHRLEPPSAENKGRYNVAQDYIILNHPAGPGNSGGPIISVQTGKVVAVYTRTTNGYSFAVPVSQIVRDVLNDPHLREP